MDRWRVRRRWVVAAAAAAVVLIAVGLRVAGWPAQSATHTPSPMPSTGLDIHTIVPDVPVVVDAEDAEALAEAWGEAPGDVARVQGPIDLPGAVGPHWVVTLVDDTTLFVGVLLGDVVEADIARRVLQPTPISSARLTIAEARELAFASVGEHVVTRDSNASVDLALVPGKAFWCGKVGSPERHLFACVDLIEQRIYGGTQADELIAATEEFRNAFFAATAAFERATAAYRLVRALGPADRLLGVPLSFPGDVAGVAEAAGLETVQGVNGPALLGPWRDVLAALAEFSGTEVMLDEDRTAMRPVPAAVGPRPRPGVAYAAWPSEGGVEGAGNGIEMQPETVAAALDVIATSMRPADGQPYDRLRAITLCETERSCVVTILGSLLGAGEDRYDFQIMADGPISLIRADYGAVPRPMVQEAERIARHDPATAALIGGYQTIAAVAWDPGTPGRLAITYERTPPGQVSSNGAPVAATLTLVDRLFVTVDTLAGRVVSTAEEPAIPPTL